MRRNRTMSVVSAALLVFGFAVFPATVDAAGKNNYLVTILRSNEAEDNTVDEPDPLLQNSWGIAASGSGPWWVANNGSMTSTIYNGDGHSFPLVVTVPGPITGEVFNSSSSFPLANAEKALFIWASEDGKFFAWNSGSGTMAEQIFSDEESSYKGLAIHGETLFSTDFAECKVEAFQFVDTAVMEVPTSGKFADASIPGSYCPFGIQAIGDSIFVTYALKGGEDDIAGQGHGLVREFDTDGNLISQVANHGLLNSPWGIALAPTSGSGFGKFSGCLLVGNFGDGRINAFCKDEEGEWHPGGLLRQGKSPVVIDGLWGIGFGNDHNSGPSTTLYFAAGPDGEVNGYFGKVEAVN